MDGMLECFGRLGRMEPFDMDVHRQWMTTCLELGRYGEASRHYGDLQRRMMREFGQPPPFELADLIQQQRQLALV
jgi:DNA-binding SARP family transcriptional activator